MARNNTMDFRLLDKESIPWELMEGCYDHTIFKSKEWADFLEKTYKALPFVVEITERDAVIGYFYGQRIKKFGVTIVASPFEGWSTSYQGLTMLSQISIHKRIDIYEELIAWLFEYKHCLFFQAADWQLEVPECLHRDLTVKLVKGFALDLTQSEESLYKNMSSRAKDPIKKSQKRGVKIQKCSDINAYADSYQLQLEDVFKQQGLSPTHTKGQTIKLLSALKDKVLALYATDESGENIASSFYVYDGDYGFYAGAASFKEKQILCPNEPLMWEAIKELKKLGVKQLEFGGGRRYKEKYGPRSIVKPKIIATKYHWLITARSIAKNSFYGMRRVFSMIKGQRIKTGKKIG